MRVLKINDLKETPMDTATAIAGWTGGAVSRTRQAVIGDGQSENFRCNVVNFRVGATTGWHVHDCDQILVVTAGKGFAATETEQRRLPSAISCISNPVSAIGMARRRIRRCRILPSRRRAALRSIKNGVFKGLKFKGSRSDSEPDSLRLNC